MTHLPTLSDRQFNALQFIANFMWEHGYQPLQTEIGAYLGITGPSARLLVIQLESKGYLKRVNKKIYLLHVPGFPYARQIMERAA